MKSAINRTLKLTPKALNGICSVGIKAISFDGKTVFDYDNIQYNDEDLKQFYFVE